MSFFICSNSAYSIWVLWRLNAYNIFTIQAHTIGNAGLVLDYYKKENIAVEQVTYFFGFPVHINVMP